VAERYAPHRLAEIAGLCEVTKPPTRLGDGGPYVIFGLRFTAEDFPRLSSISNSICCPSLSELRPARSTAEIWTNTLTQSGHERGLRAILILSAVAP
jgi:hypothetical protein